MVYQPVLGGFDQIHLAKILTSRAQYISALKSSEGLAFFMICTIITYKFGKFKLLVWFTIRGKEYLALRQSDRGSRHPTLPNCGNVCLLDINLLMNVKIVILWGKQSDPPTTNRHYYLDREELPI